MILLTSKPMAKAKNCPILVFILVISVFVFNFDINRNELFSRPDQGLTKYIIPRVEAKKKKKKTKKFHKAASLPRFQNPLIISGDDICRRNSEEALKILFDKDKKLFDFVVSNLGKIECTVSGSGVYVWESPPRFQVGVATSNADPLWYASVLVHESCHIKQFKRSEGQNQPSDVSQKEYSGEKAEIECLGIQLEALKRLGADQLKIDYLENVAQSRYWLLNNSQRWW